MVVLAVSVLFIILGTTKLKIHPFIVLLLAAYMAGAMAGLPVGIIAVLVANGFGSIMATIGIVIVLGTIIGIILEKSHAAVKLAEIVMRRVGKRFPGLAMSIIGYMVSIPVFCDSAFVILSSLKKSLVQKTGKPSVTLSIALATGLYATHTFVPPAPGPIARCRKPRAGKPVRACHSFRTGSCVVCHVVRYFWAIYVGKKFTTKDDERDEETQHGEIIKLPSGTLSLAPILVPIFLIALRSIATYPTKPLGESFFFTLIDFSVQPVNALFSGLFLSFLLFPKFNKETLTGWIGDGISAAAPILLITGAGGAFGAILKETRIGETIGYLLSDYQLGIFLPFIIAAAFKTAQGFIHRGTGGHFGADSSPAAGYRARFAVWKSVGCYGYRRRRHDHFARQRQLFLGGHPVFGNGCENRVQNPYACYSHPGSFFHDPYLSAHVNLFALNLKISNSCVVMVFFSF
jgi:GntP family gluconate:H+ symporter